MNRIEIPAKHYPRPTLKESLTFASTPFSEEGVEQFIKAHGFFKRLPTVQQTRTFSTAQLQPGGLPEDLPGSPWSEPVAVWSGPKEGLDLWRREWQDMAAFEGIYSAIMSHPSERPPVTFELPTPAGIFRGDVLLSHDEVEPLFLVDEASESAPLRRNAARIVSMKLDENAPLTGFAFVDGTVMKWTAGNLLLHIWTLFFRLLTGAMEAKRCISCGIWEVKGDGYKRSNWLIHARCSQNERQRVWREREKERNMEALKKLRESLN